MENSLNPPFKEKLNKEFVWQPINITLSIGHFLGGIVSYSLGEFLLNNDRRKLKRCPYCNNFFIAKSINRKTSCYEPGCEKAYQRDKKRKQRELEPDIYY